MNFSLCCISIGLKEKGHGFQTMTYKRFSSLDQKQSIKILSERILNNFKVTNMTMQECFDQGIKGYRISSSILPLINHPKINLKLKDLPNYTDILIEIEEIKKTIQRTNIFTSTHPSAEFITLTSDNQLAVDNSIRDLEQHSELMDLFGLPQSHESPMNIHVRKEGEPEIIYKKFLKNYKKLSEGVRKRLVLENNDNVGGTWHVSNLIKYFHDRLGICITYDNLHHKFCHGNISDEDAFNLAYKTWDVVPTFHHSEGVKNTRKHADYAVKLPIEYKTPVKWEVEVKMKDLAIKKLLELYDKTVVKKK